MGDLKTRADHIEAARGLLQAASTHLIEAGLHEIDDMLDKILDAIIDAGIQEEQRGKA